MISSALLTLVVIPALYAAIKTWQLEPVPAAAC
jgi:Cu/Ag efflux pump CusA